MTPIRIPVTTLEDLDALDDAEIIEGYHDGRGGEPEPGDNRGRAYWHGWRNGAADAGRIKVDVAMEKLVHLFLARERARRKAVA